MRLLMGNAVFEISKVYRPAETNVTVVFEHNGITPEQIILRLNSREEALSLQKHMFKNGCFEIKTEEFYSDGKPAAVPGELILYERSGICLGHAKQNTDKDNDKIQFPFD